MDDCCCKKRILLVDDDEIHLSILSNILEVKYDILIAKSGKEAIEFFFKGQYPDLALLDILMPDMDGWETYKRIKAFSLLKDIPMLFVSAVDDAPTKSRAQELGALDFITKPCDPEDLLTRISRAIKS